MAHLHPAIVHFPIVLLLVWPALDALGWALGRPDVGRVALGLLGLGAVSSLAAAISGEAALAAAVEAGASASLLRGHGEPAGWIPWGALALVALRGFGPQRWPRAARAVAIAGGLLLGGGVLAAGASGGALVHDHGIR